MSVEGRACGVPATPQVSKLRGFNPLPDHCTTLLRVYLPTQTTFLRSPRYGTCMLE